MTCWSRGSGYIARHDKDFLLANDPWFRGMEMKYGPDGGVYLTDWSDIGECHENDDDGAHRENGRIYKITYGDVKRVQVDLNRASDEELVKYQLHKNDWYVRTARRLLQERAAAGKDMVNVHKRSGSSSKTIPTTPASSARSGAPRHGRLERKNPQRSLQREERTSPSLAVRLLSEPKKPSSGWYFGVLASRDPSPRVRLHLASALQRFPIHGRASIARRLMSHEEDSRDPMIPLMVWYALEPVAAKDSAEALSIPQSPREVFPLVRQYLVRRVVAADARTGLALVVPMLDEIDDPQVQAATGCSGSSRPCVAARTCPGPRAGPGSSPGCGSPIPR